MTLNTIVLAAYAPSVTDDADALIDGVSMTFTDLTATKDMTEFHLLYEHMTAKYGDHVLVIHIGTMKRLLDAVEADHEAH